MFLGDETSELLLWSLWDFVECANGSERNVASLKEKKEQEKEVKKQARKKEQKGKEKSSIFVFALRL